MRQPFFTWIAALCASMVGPAAYGGIELQRLGTYSAGVFNAGASEISAHDPQTQRLFVVNAAASGIDILDISNPSSPTLFGTIDVTPFGAQANSVDFRNGVLAAAVQANVKTDPGKAVFFDAAGNALSAVNVGALPDMLTFTPDGKRVLVANEGEPNDDYTVDPEGSVSIIDLTPGAANLTQRHVTTAGFTAFNNCQLDPSIRIYGPNATVAQDLEPEYIAVSHDSRLAWVTLQENNAVGVLDVKHKRFLALIGLGFKNHSQHGKGLDASDRDNAIRIATRPVLGMYMPDSIATFRFFGIPLLVMANEGDSRAYPGFDEEARVKDVTLDPAAFPDAASLRLDANIGRLKMTKAQGDTDGDGDFDRIHSFGARSFSIRTITGQLVYDSGDELEQITAQALPEQFNSTNDANGSFDSRSDDKGPEPEGLTVAKIGFRTYLFLGLERIGGVMVFDISDPFHPQFVQYVNNRDFEGNAAAGTAGDLGPEGLLFIPEDESPINAPLLVVANEISGTTTIYKVASGP
jgi:hypothetical protein